MVVLNGEPLDGHQKNYSLQLYLPGKYQLIVLMKQDKRRR